MQTPKSDVLTHSQQRPTSIYSKINVNANILRLMCLKMDSGNISSSIIVIMGIVLFTDTVSKWVFALFTDRKKCQHLIKILHHLTIYLKKNSRFGQTVEDRGEFVRNFYLQTVIILALLFRSTEMTRFTFKKQMTALGTVWRARKPSQHLRTFNTLFQADRKSNRSCKNQNAHFLVFACLHGV